MISLGRRAGLAVRIVIVLSVALNPPNPVPAANPPDAEAVAGQLRTIAGAGTLADLKFPDFPDYRQQVQGLYEAVNYTPVWVHDGQPTIQAQAVITAIQVSRLKGLNPEEYDASRWPLRLNALKSAPGDATKVAHFDAALTVSAMRYISDLHIGRVNPKHFKFGIDVAQKSYDLPQFLLQKLLPASNVPEVLKGVEPPYYGYQRTVAALKNYLALADQDHSAPLPEVQKTLAPGDAYPGAEALGQRLQLLSDLPRDTAPDNKPGIYEGSLVEGVKHFQVRHGLTADGRLGKDTLRQLNTPLSVRIQQLDDALERWRWLPVNFSPLPVGVNIPEFVLRVFSPDHRIALRMNVVVGKAVRNETPVFAKDMRYIVFRPYWNVPYSITRSEIIPALVKDSGYLARKDFEITDQSGRIVTGGAVSADMLAQLRSGKMLVRQRPGPTNSLGLVKFMFPNEYNVYLHSTPAQQLFSQSRRDFSHGCIRVEKPAELAAWLLQGQPKWTLDAVKAAMQSGPDNQQVNLDQPVPVVIIYLTAVVEENGEVHFFDDIYGHDRTLNAVLAKGPPYPAI
ncbi:MAG TPA: L,D-transpeptidase family protein [Acidobacteriaceae bacterium]|nr:L,D-transpeptidase family protein [Acidobacteriaceae bacterium]